MRFRLWIKRMRGFRLRRLRRTRINLGNERSNLSGKERDGFFDKESPVFVTAGNLLMSTPVEISPCSRTPIQRPQVAACVVTQRDTAVSPCLPLPSPAFKTTPTKHNSPLALKDLLGFEPVDRQRKPNGRITHFAFALSCCTKVHKIEIDTESKYREQWQHCLRAQRFKLRLQRANSMWTGVCPCMVMNVAKGTVRKSNDVGAAAAGKTALRRRFLSSSIANQQNEQSIGQPEDSCDCLRTDAAIGGIERKCAGNRCEMESTSSSDTTKPCAEQPSPTPDAPEARAALTEHVLSFTNDTSRRAHSGKLTRNVSHQSTDHLSVQHQSSTQIVGVPKPLPEQQASFAGIDSYFKVESGLLSAVSSAAKTDKRELQPNARIRQRIGIPWIHKRLRDGPKHRQQLVSSHGCSMLGSIDDCMLETNPRSFELDSEEESLLHADSYQSSCQSPRLGDHLMTVATFGSSIDLEANARPWVFSEKDASMVSVQISSDLQEHNNFKREPSNALIQRYHGLDTLANALKMDTSLRPVKITNDNKRVDALSAVHDYNASSCPSTNAYTVREFKMHHSKSDTEIETVNQEINPKHHISKHMRDSDHDESLPNNRSKNGKVEHPYNICCTNQQLVKPSEYVFSFAKSRSASTDMPVKTAHQSKPNTIAIPSRSVRPSNVHVEKKQSLALENRGEKGSEIVQKKSRDPLLDFTDSMLDMILQNHLCTSKELEELLQCFLSINSLEHHNVIVQAFTDLWEKVVIGKAA